MTVITLYGPGIRNAIASGDLKQMEATLHAAEQHLKEHGDVSAAVEALKAEIARQHKKSALAGQS